MKATINGVTVEGTPHDMVKFVNIMRLADMERQEDSLPENSGPTPDEQADMLKEYHEQQKQSQNYQKTIWMQNDDTQKVMGMGEIIGDTKSRTIHTYNGVDVDQYLSDHPVARAAVEKTLDQYEQEHLYGQKQSEKR